MRKVEAIRSSVYYKTLVLQAMIAAMTAVAFGAIKGQTDAMSAAYGGASAWVLGLLLGLSVYCLAQRTKKGESAQTAIGLVLGLMPRLLLTLVFFWFGLWVLQLPPQPMLAGFVLTYLGYLVSFYKLRYK